MNNKNPYNICTWDDQVDCQKCNSHGKLACKWDKKLLGGFHGVAWPAIIIIIFGIVFVGILTGIWWPLVAYIIYFFLMFGIFEIRFLCSHCPYYAEEDKILHCLANHGSYKFWSYHPGPLNSFEKFMMYFLIVTIFFVFPMSIMGYGIWFLSIHFINYGLISLMGLIGISLASMLSSISFYSTIKIFFCPYCVNFSCPLNTVPKAQINEYLMRNEIMREAWEKSGWKID
ncbi:MAG: hypothetical protein GY865_01265 [candidate division Zixibacteria bacterium]|nr:hypothetical protein [candidate division Zixibacteria bacterium]